MAKLKNRRKTKRAAAKRRSRIIKYFKKLTAYKLPKVVIKPDPYIVGDMWRFILVRGLTMLSFGGVVLIWPNITLRVLTLVVALWLLLMGLTDSLAGARSIKNLQQWFNKLALGLLEIITGTYLLHNANVDRLAIITVLGLLTILQGIIELNIAIKKLADLDKNLWLAVASIISIVGGSIVLRQTNTTGLGFVWIVGLYALLIGTFGIANSLSIRIIKSGR